MPSSHSARDALYVTLRTRCSAAQASVERRDAIGGTSKRSVLAQAAELKEWAAAGAAAEGP